MRLENWVDMSQYRGFNHWWNNSQFPKSIKFALDLPVAAFSATTVKLLTLPLDKMVHAIEINQLSTNHKLNLFEFIYRPANRGFGALLSGTPGTLGRHVPKMTLLFTVNENLQERWLAPATPNNMIGYSLRAFWAGALSGALVHGAFYPLDYARMAMIPDAAGARIYTSPLNCLERVYVKEGYRGAYCGFLTSTIGATLYRGLYFGGFELGKVWAFEGDAQETPLAQTYALAQTVATGSALLTHPFEVVRRRLVYQTYPYNTVHYWNGIDCVKKLIRNHGIGTLIRDGLHLTAIKSLGGGLLLVLFDTIKLT